MRSLGFLLLVLGLASTAFHFMGRELRVLGWIDNWGETAAWGIRGGCVVLGAILLLAGKAKPKPAK